MASPRARLQSRDCASTSSPSADRSNSRYSRDQVRRPSTMRREVPLQQKHQRLFPLMACRTAARQAPFSGSFQPTASAPISDPAPLVSPSQVPAAPSDLETTASRRRRSNGMSTASAMSRTLDAGPIAASHRRHHAARSRLKSGGAGDAPGRPGNTSRANEAVTSLPRTPRIISAANQPERWSGGGSWRPAARQLCQSCPAAIEHLVERRVVRRGGAFYAPIEQAALEKGGREPPVSVVRGVEDRLLAQDGDRKRLVECGGDLCLPRVLDLTDSPRQ